MRQKMVDLGKIGKLNNPVIRVSVSSNIWQKTCKNPKPPSGIGGKAALNECEIV